MKGLAISGSLRMASHNTALLRAAIRLTPEGMSIELYRELGELPLFNPDLEDKVPAVVSRLREQINEADFVMIASPEYAHGIAGAFKNALDWMVSTKVFVNKPIVLFNASPRAFHARDSLKEIVTVMSGLVDERVSVSVPILGSGLDEDGIFADPGISQTIRKSFQILIESDFPRMV